jgi:hypothetical protein
MTRDPRRQRATLEGWSKWLPFVVLPFAFFFLEAWLQTQQLKLDYETNRITSAMRRLDEQINDLRVLEASLDNLERMQAHAPDLGLVEAKRDQIHVVRIDYDDGAVGKTPALALAQLPMPFMDPDEVE